MAKKATKAKAKTTTSSSQVVVKITGGALPSSLCFVAGEILSRASEAIRLAHGLNNREGGIGDKKASIEYASQALHVLQVNFPLTKEALAPLEKKFDALAKSKLKSKRNESVTAALEQASREIGILGRKARQGCNVNRV